MSKGIEHPNRALLSICQTYDGLQSIKEWITTTVDLSRRGTYERLLSHAVSIGLDVTIVPENSKLIVTVNIRI